MPKRTEAQKAEVLPAEEGAQAPSPSGKVRLRFVKDLVYYRGRFYRLGEELEASPEEVPILRGYAKEV